MMAIIEATLTTEPASQFTLILRQPQQPQHDVPSGAGRSGKTAIPQRLQVVHLFSQESMDSDPLQGRIDGDKLRALAKPARFQPL